MNASSESAPDARALHERLGRVGSQPVDVHSFTNKRLTVNYRSPIDRLRRIVPEPLELEELGSTGRGVISMCVCDFRVTRIGLVPVPPLHTNEMLCRVSVRVPKDGATKRAYYTLRSDTSSVLLGLLGGRFSHFRKATSAFTRRDDGSVYALKCRADDELCGGEFSAALGTLSKKPPATSCFANVAAATDFLFELDGSCGYDYATDRLSFQEIEYPEWDLSFCHVFRARFPLIEHLERWYDLDLEFDCALFMQNVRQVWRSAWLYPAPAAARRQPEPEPQPAALA